MAIVAIMNDEVLLRIIVEKGELKIDEGLISLRLIKASSVRKTIENILDGRGIVVKEDPLEILLEGRR